VPSGLAGGLVKLLTYGPRSFLVAADLADALVDYAAVLADAGAGDEVAITGIAPDGDRVDIRLVLNSGTSLLAESSGSALPDPDNGDLVQDLRGRTAALRGNQSSTTAVVESEPEKLPDLDFFPDLD
jgi:hypothetical protein